MQFLVVAERLTLSTVTTPLLDAASFSVNPRSRIALVGRNGSGKSTLLDLIDCRARGSELPEQIRVQGSLVVGAGVRVGSLPQSPTVDNAAHPVDDYLNHCSSGPVAVHAAFARATERMATEQSSVAVDAYARALDAMTTEAAWDYPSRRAAVLDNLLGGIDVQRSLGSLSGGETTKVALAGLLLSDPDLLLLDEPTNNLDADALAFLVSWLAASEAAMVVVSHDRAFLDEVVTEVFAIDEFTLALQSYGGNYSAYAAQRDLTFDARTRQFEEQTRARQRLIDDTHRLDRAASTFERTQNDYRRARGKKVARRAVVQRARIERQLYAIAEPLRPRQPRITVPHVSQPHDPLLVALHNCDLGIDGRLLLERVDLTITAGCRMAISGANGSGKTTLLRVLNGDVPALSGVCTRPVGVRVAMLAQSPPPPRRGQTVLDYARHLAPLSEDEVGELLGKVLFGDVAHRPVGAFSIGERRRIELAVLFAAGPHLVLLDEPTNHLDIPTIEMLEAGLDDYVGAVVAVSHDRHFLSRLGPHPQYEICDRRLAAQSTPARDTTEGRVR